MSKERILMLPIKQVFFNAILNGEKKQETREIKDTTFKKYLACWTEDGESGIEYDDELISDEDFAKYPNDPLIYNNGVYPYFVREYDYLRLVAGYRKDRDTMLVRVKGAHVEQMKTKTGETVQYDIDAIQRTDGDFTFWQIVYELGDIVETDLKKDRK